MDVIFTSHAQSRIKKRKIAVDEVIEAIRFPEILMKKRGRYYYRKEIEKGTIEVVCEKEKIIKVITVYWL